MLSAAITVRPSGCWYTSPTSKSSYTRPLHPCLIVIISLRSIGFSLCRYQGTTLVVPLAISTFQGFIDGCKNNVLLNQKSSSRWPSTSARFHQRASRPEGPCVYFPIGLYLCSYQ